MKDFKGNSLLSLMSNPMYGILTLEWFVALMNDIRTNLSREFNLYIINDNNYKDYKREYGRFAAMLSFQKVVNIVNGIESKPEDLFIGQFTDRRLILFTRDSIQNRLIELNHNNELDIDINIGHTQCLPTDDKFSVIVRAENALNIAMRKNVTYQKL